MEGAKVALARTQVVLILVLIVVAAGVGAYIYTQASSGMSGHQEVVMNIVETDPVNQIDSFVPQNVTVKQGTIVTLAVHNGDDEVRVVTIAGLNVNFTITNADTGRVSFTADNVGTFTVFSPMTAPSAVSRGKAGSAVTGFLTVTPS